MRIEGAFEVYQELLDAESRAKEIYTVENPTPVLGSWWVHHNYIEVKDGEFWLNTTKTIFE